VVGCTVWESGDIDIAQFGFGDAITTTDVGEAAAAANQAAPQAVPAALMAFAAPAAGKVPAKVYTLENAPFEQSNVEATPQLVIDPASASGIDAFMAFDTPKPVDPADASKGTRSNLRVLSRKGGAWTQTDLPGGDVSNPSLALTHDAGVKPAAVVVYEKLVGYDSRAAAQTFRNIVTHTELASRYFDGTTWSAETALTPTDGKFDMQPVVAFNGKAGGVAAWMHGSTANPFSPDGNSFLRNSQDIQASLWIPASHSWSAPVTLSPAGDTQADSKPAAYVDAAGNAYVVWIRGDANASQLFFSRYDAATGKWSAAANLPVAGLPAGTIDGVTLGADKAGRIDTIFSMRAKGANGASYSGLYNRPAMAASFGAAATYETISKTSANYMHVRTTTAPDGSLVASWQQNTGADDGVYVAKLSRLSPATAGVPWTDPVKLTSTADATRQPTVAVETDGTMQVVYASRAFPTLNDDSPAPAVLSGKSIAGVDNLLGDGVATASFAPLPELTFTKPLAFAGGGTAAIGTDAMGMATIANTGLADDTVTIDWYRGTTSTGTIGARSRARRRSSLPRGRSMISPRRSPCRLAPPRTRCGSRARRARRSPRSMTSRRPN